MVVKYDSATNKKRVKVLGSTTVNVSKHLAATDSDKTVKTEKDIVTHHLGFIYFTDWPLLM